MGFFCQYMGIGHWTCAIPPHCQSLSCLYLYICVFVYLCLCIRFFGVFVHESDTGHVLQLIIVSHWSNYIGHQQ